MRVPRTCLSPSPRDQENKKGELFFFLKRSNRHCALQDTNGRTFFHEIRNIQETTQDRRQGLWVSTKPVLVFEKTTQMGTLTSTCSALRLQQIGRAHV